MSSLPSLAARTWVENLAICGMRKSSGKLRGQGSSSKARSPLLIRISAFSVSVKRRLRSDSRQKAIPLVSSTRRSSTKKIRARIMKSRSPCVLTTSRRLVTKRPSGQWSLPMYSSCWIFSNASDEQPVTVPSFSIPIATIPPSTAGPFPNAERHSASPTGAMRADLRSKRVFSGCWTTNSQSSVVNTWSGFARASTVGRSRSSKRLSCCTTIIIRPTRGCSSSLLEGARAVVDHKKFLSYRYTSSLYNLFIPTTHRRGAASLWCPVRANEHARVR